MPSADRINIVLPQSDQDLVDLIADRTGVGSGGRSAVIRRAVRELAANLGLLPAPEKTTQGRKKA